MSDREEGETKATEAYLSIPGEEIYRLKNEFKRLGFDSAFDVLHVSRAKFIEKYKATLSDEGEAGKVYEWAVGEANRVAQHYHAGSRLETIMQLSTLNQATPNITVMDNRGLSVRQLGYYRRAEKDAAEVRIGVQRYDNRGQLVSAFDPRLSESYLKDTSTLPNQQQQSSLLGGVLQSSNVDAGSRVVLSDCRGKSVWSNDSRGTERYVIYDELGREQRVYEKEKDQEWMGTERLRYGNSSNTEKGQNAVGQLLEQYGSSGRLELEAYSVLGQLKKQKQTFLKAEEAAHWTEAETENAQRLEEEGYRSEWRSNGLGEAVSQIDAKGNERKTVYEVSGQIKALRLKLNSGTEKILSEERKYTVNGQLAEEKLGNGIRMHYRYEALTQRLSEKEAKRLVDNQSLQFLHYTYDPVGNILAIEDRAKAIEHFKNEKTESINHYVYDSFYQLIESQGIESSQAGKETPKLPQAMPLGTSDASRLVNYKRTYRYDAGGNLFEIQHQGSNPYTQKLEIDQHSNRGIEERETGPSLQKSFDANGNLLYLNTGQPLSWDSRNQLKEAIQLERESNTDKEVYVYDSQGSRVEKRRSYLAKTQTHHERVRYLPGLEIRDQWQTDSQGKNKKIKEELQVIQAQAGEPVRVLYWETGKPEEIENETIYYSLSDQIGSNQLELNETGEVVSYESYYPYGGTAVWATKNQIEANYKYQRYSGKERDITGLYYYGYRYYLPWLGRWLNADPSGISDGLNLFQMVANNPITFYDPDGQVKKTGAGKGQPTFKELYPETVMDPEIDELYRPIREIYGFNTNKTKRQRVNVRVYEYDIEGKGVYLFTGDTQAKRLVIYSHGLFDEGFSLEEISLNRDTPNIEFLGPHKEVLQTLEHYHDRTYAKITHEGITFSAAQAEQHFHTLGYSKITGTHTLGAIYNYSLKKVETVVKASTFEGTFQSHAFELLADLVETSRYSRPVDFLRIRKYRGENVDFQHYLTVSDVLDFAQDLDYETVVLSHCRSPRWSFDNQETIFRSKDTQLSLTPKFRLWNEMVGQSNRE